MNRLFLAMTCVLGCLSAFALAQTPLGTAFTYQGEVRSAGTPVQDGADFRFRLYDAAAGGTQIGPALSANTLNISDGRFSVSLDFGAGAFGANARWLEIDVRSPAGSGNFTTLSPRQAIAAAPAAQFALGPWQTSGAAIAYNSGRVGIGTISPQFLLDVEVGTGTGIACHTAGATTQAFAISGTSDSNYYGVGVYGHSTATSGGEVAGVFGECDSSGGTGIVGKGHTGVHGDGQDFVDGTGVSGDGHFALYGSSYNDGYGLFTNSRIYAGDILLSGGHKAFRIDHPDDPANKYLLHYCAEGPEPQNIYNGTAILDEHGEAVVVLPGYFAKINKDPRYQLTAVGMPMPMLHIAEKVSIDSGVCSFRIGGGAARGEVSWEVKAVRNDIWAQKHAAPVEVEKPDMEKGKFQHPELYGQPAELGIGHRAAAGGVASLRP